MIVQALCNTCLQPYELLIQVSDIDLVRQIADEKGMTAPCPRLCGGRINIVGDPVIAVVKEGKRLAEALRITGTELYKAVNGAGLPDEIMKDKDVLESILKSNRVVSVSIEESHGKLYLHEIKLENGVTLHLGASTRGACVVKMTKERKNGTSPRA